jgi:CYTH domain-containing protein
MENIEIERKFIVELPKSWEDLSILLEDIIQVQRITQIYLKKENDKPSVRIRKTIQGFSNKTETIYHINQKEKIEEGINKEKEEKISEEQYNSLLKEADPNRNPVKKTRFVFSFEDQIFELDIFKGKLKGLAILELELNDKDQEISLPPFLKILKEVTKDKDYNNYNLAAK